MGGVRDRRIMFFFILVLNGYIKVKNVNQVKNKWNYFFIGFL